MEAMDDLFRILTAEKVDSSIKAKLLRETSLVERLARPCESPAAE
jgi:hypothetical protein